MKVISPAEMVRLETMAFEQGAKSESFMEEVGQGIAQKVEAFIKEKKLSKVVTLLCGKGNNGGDAYVAGFYLLKNGFAVSSYQMTTIDACSPLCQKNQRRFIDEGGLVTIVNSSADFFFPSKAVIIDGIFGTGFKGAVEGLYSAAIASANGSCQPIISIDIPSGLDGETGEVKDVSIKATKTLFLALPKTGFFLEEGWNNVGSIEKVEYSLDEKLIVSSFEEFILVTSDLVKPLLPSFHRTRHKYEAGSVVGWASSSGMSGAGLLASTAALKVGAGIVRLFHPKGMEAELGAVPFELIKESIDINDTSKILHKMNNATSCFIGPGIGLGSESVALLEQLVKDLEKPCVFDADALTIIAREKWTLPVESIITPHIGEMKRLLGVSNKGPLNREFLTKCQNYVDQHQIILLLKGAPTFILTPKETILICPRGDPGMATAGSGDVLTGLIAGLMAQGLRSREGAILGAYLHGLSGELAAQDLTSFCLMASDLINYLPSAFKNL